MDSSMDASEPYNDLYHDDIMKAISLFPSLDRPLNFMNPSINSDTECDLPDNEQAVDLIKYLDFQDGDSIKQEVISPEHDTISYLLKSPERVGRALQLVDEFGPTVASWNPGPTDSPSRKVLPSEWFTSPAAWFFSPEKSNLLNSPEKADWFNTPEKTAWSSTPEKSTWMRTCVKQEPEIPSDPFINAWFPVTDKPIKAEMSDVLDIPEWKPFYDEEIYPDLLQEETESVVASSDESEVDFFVDVETVETVQDATWSTDMFDRYTSDESTSTAPRKKKVYTARVISMPKPVGRPRGSKKQTAAAASGKASTSQNTPQPSCSRATLEAARSAVPGQKRKLAKCETVTSAQSQPAYTQALGASYSVNFHDYAMSPLASAAAAAVETARPTIPARRAYRRNTSLDNVDINKQNHHNQLERNRRQKLADLFNALREEVATTVDNPKASKVSILQEATKQIKGQQAALVLQNNRVLREEQKQSLLSNQLRLLKAEICRRVK